MNTGPSVPLTRLYVRISRVASGGLARPDLRVCMYTVFVCAVEELNERTTRKFVVTAKGNCTFLNDSLKR